jgi:hypothetical protein
VEDACCAGVNPLLDISVHPWPVKAQSHAMQGATNRKMATKWVGGVKPIEDVSMEIVGHDGKFDTFRGMGYWFDQGESVIFPLVWLFLVAA